MVDSVEMLAAVSGRDRTGVDEVIAPTAANADQEKNDRRDAGEHNSALAQRAECATRLAFGNGIATGSIRKRSVLTFTAARFRTSACPMAFDFARFHDEARRALVSGTAFALRRGTDAARAALTGMSTFPICIGADVFVGGKLRGFAIVTHEADAENK